ncbi:hypothetical protein ACQP3C_30810, partial [Escherichia coli]
NPVFVGSRFLTKIPVPQLRNVFPIDGAGILATYMLSSRTRQRHQTTDNKKKNVFHNTVHVPKDPVKKAKISQVVVVT